MAPGVCGTICWPTGLSCGLTPDRAADAATGGIARPPQAPAKPAAGYWACGQVSAVAAQRARPEHSTAAAGLTANGSPTSPIIWTAEGWLYVAAVVDLFSRRVVGWSMQYGDDHAAGGRCPGDGDLAARQA
jgi:hypothetical protein